MNSSRAVFASTDAAAMLRQIASPLTSDVCEISSCGSSRRKVGEQILRRDRESLQGADGSQPRRRHDPLQSISSAEAKPTHHVSAIAWMRGASDHACQWSHLLGIAHTEQRRRKERRIPVGQDHGSHGNGTCEGAASGLIQSRDVL